MDDLKWVNEFRVINHKNDNNINILVDQHQARRNSYNCPIEHMIMDIRKLALGYIMVSFAEKFGFLELQHFKHT